MKAWSKLRARIVPRQIGVPKCAATKVLKCGHRAVGGGLNNDWKEGQESRIIFCLNSYLALLIMSARAGEEGER